MSSSKLKTGLAGLIVLTLAGFGAVACNSGPSCPQGQVAEWDDDGWECEPDENNNGVDDEEDNDD